MRNALRNDTREVTSWWEGKTKALISRKRKSVARVAACAMMMSLAACSSRSGEIPSEPTYPAKASSGSIDVQVVRDETVVRMTNTTARDLASGRLWANRWFSREFPGLKVGESITMSLSEFKDQYGDRYRAGGFFATDRPMKLVQMELETGEQLIGLIVVAVPE